MYTQIWKKYLPVIRILLKRSMAADQTLSLDAADFERAGAGATRKPGSKFDLQFTNGRAAYVIPSSALAKELSAVLLEDEAVKNLFTQNDYKITLAAKYTLGINCLRRLPAGETPVNEVATNQ